MKVSLEKSENTGKVLPMLEKHRQQQILEILEHRQFASVRSLTKELNASEATIRRDITKMSNRGEINKIRGGAESINGQKKKIHLSATSFVEDKTKQADIKKLLAKKAVELCSDGDSIIINGGSSTYMMGEYLSELQLHILTNSFVLAASISENSNSQVSLPGGEIYRDQGIILSSYESDTTENYRASMMFTGTPGIGEFGVMESDPLLIRSEQKLKKQTEKLVVLADSTKLGQRSNFIFCPLTEVDILITDSNAAPDLIELFKSKNIEVIIVDTKG